MKGDLDWLICPNCRQSQARNSPNPQTHLAAKKYESLLLDGGNSIDFANLKYCPAQLLRCQTSHCLIAERGEADGSDTLIIDGPNFGCLNFRATNISIQEKTSKFPRDF